MNRGNKKTRRGHWETAVEEGLTGLFVALVVSVLIYSTPLTRFGTDLSQKILLAANVSGGPLGGNAEDGARAPANWVFVDLGGRFCGSDDGGTLCPPARTRTDRRPLAALLTGLRSHHPRAIILDIATEPGDAAEDEALKTLLQQRGAPILLSWSPAAEDIQALSDGRLNLAAARDHFLCDPAACDFPDARYFPSLRRVSQASARWLSPDASLASADGNWSADVPTLPRAAALVANAPGDAPWSLIDQQQALPADNCNVSMSAGCMEAWRATERVFSFAPVHPGANRTDTRLQNGVSFTHYTPDADAEADTMPRTLQDGVVVVGDSRRSAGDRVWSAVGDVSGAELILNDVRQFTLTPPQAERGLVGHLWAESMFLLLGFLAILVVHLRVARRPHRRRATIGAAALEIATSTGTLLLVMLVTTLLYAVYLFVRGVEPGAPPDIVTPFLGTMLEGFLDLMHRLIGFVQQLAKRGVDAVSARMRGASA